MQVVGAVAGEFARVVHVVELVATLWADDEVVAKELDEGAAVITRRTVFDDVNAHTNLL